MGGRGLGMLLTLYRDANDTAGLFATLIMLDAQLRWMNANGGLEWCAARSDASAAALYGWVEAREWATPFVADPAKRSAVVGTVDLDDEIAAADVNAALRANGIVDTDSYRKLGRNQLRIGMFPAIDPADAKDHDDAVCAEPDTDEQNPGGHIVTVAIADVAAYVTAGSALDREALKRGNSVYFPEHVIPMLPELISNGLASLQPGKVRYTKSVYIEFTAEGVRTHVEAQPAAIKSSKRLTYEQVDRYLADPAAWTRKLGKAVHALLGRMHELAMILRRRRFDHGALDMNMPEVEIDLDKHGQVIGAHKAENTVSHQIIEEFMLAANEAVAEHLHGQDLNFLRRVHEPPDPRKLQALTEFVRELGIDCESLQNRFEIKRVVEAVKGEPREHAVHYAVLRSMQKAVYGPQEEGHFALHSKHYCHFTSPIRRYPDLVIHRMLDSLLCGTRPPDDFDDLAVQGEHCSEREQRAEAAERELIKVKLLTFLSHRIGESLEAVITGVEQFGLFAQGIELPAEGMIRIEALADDFYRYDRQTHSLTGYRHGQSYRLGDLVQVEIAHVDVDRRELDFRLVRRLDHPSGRKTLTAPRPARPKARVQKKTELKRQAAQRTAKRRRGG